MNFMPLRVLDLFGGCGGFTTGLLEAGFDVVAGIDFWQTAIDTYKQNHDHLAVCADLTKLSPSEFSRQSGISATGLDIIASAPLCQGVSLTGRRDPRDPRNSLFMEFVKYLAHFQPMTFLMENVVGLLSMKIKNGNTKVIDVIMEYNCRICVVTASDFEVPQNRRRVIILGIRKDLNIHPWEPEPFLDSDERVPVRAVLAPRAIEGINTRKEMMKQKGYGFGAQFLKFDQPSYAIPARCWKDGTDALVKYDENNIRLLTESELQKIQTFPDGYQFCGSKRDVVTQNRQCCAVSFGSAHSRHALPKCRRRVGLRP